MKKIGILVTTLLIIAIAGTTIGYAAEIETYKTPADFFKSKLEFKRDRLNEAKKEGYITEEKAKVWEKHFDDMEKFHGEHGFFGEDANLGCRRREYDKEGFGYGRGFGRGKMGRHHSWKTQ